ncbi:C-C motif chemokine 22 isoform X1 [Trichosurus vulpecula]|uniref:C-C motif chemokine 22 isoform X1 n=1 Tax=Trichosurus vulpecula TaxID=9337 RepID=UPI00186B303D|nr:C-C motif chemokine 22 isoform X1 [Trichosurus vulpecula]
MGLPSKHFPNLGVPLCITSNQQIESTTVCARQGAPETGFEHADFPGPKSELFPLRHAPVLSSASSSFKGPYGVNIEISVCCKNFVQFPLPLKALTTFRFTSDPCQKRGVILTTKKNREICADPHKAWVKHAIKYIKKKD